MLTEICLPESRSGEIYLYPRGFAARCAERLCLSDLSLFNVKRLCLQKLPEAQPPPRPGLSRKGRAFPHIKRQSRKADQIALTDSLYQGKMREA